MKKILLIATIFLSCLPSVFSQTPHFGFDVGFSLNRAAYTSLEAFNRRFFGGFDGGLLVEIPLSKRIMVQPELNYTITGVELNNGTEKSLKLQYLTIPLLVKVKVANGFNLLAGPQHSILLSGWSDPSGEGPSKDIKDNFEFSDLLVVVGGEYKCRSGFFFGARYNYGIEQIAEDGVGFEMKNRYISARIGYTFGGQK